MSTKSSFWTSNVDRLFEFLSKGKVLASLTVVPALLFFVAITLLPMVWAFIAGFYEIPIFSPEWEWVGFANHLEVLADDLFYHSLWKGFVFSASGTVLQLVVGIGLALLINRDFAYSTFVRGIAFLPYMIPTAILGYLGLWMNNGTAGIVNQFLVQLGLIDSYIGWYGMGDTAMGAVVLTYSWKYSIFVMIMVLAQLQSIPDSHYEAAKISGASWYQQFRDITLPNLKGVIFIVLLLRGIWNFNKFDIIWVLTGGGPSDATYTPPIYAYEAAFSSNELGIAAAISSLLFILLIIFAIIYFVVFEPEKEVRVE